MTMQLICMDEMINDYPLIPCRHPYNQAALSDEHGTMMIGSKIISGRGTHFIMI